MPLALLRVSGRPSFFDDILCKNEDAPAVCRSKFLAEVRVADVVSSERDIVPACLPAYLSKYSKRIT